MKLRIVLALSAVAVFATFFLYQVKEVSAKNTKGNGPLTSPLTSPCKPGNGFGDKNHCHYGAPGQLK
jgi:hypothetical protein